MSAGHARTSTGETKAGGGPVRHAVREIVSLRPGPLRWAVGLQAALAMSLPVAVFTLAGHEQLGLLALSGALTSLYLNGRSRRQRAVALPVIGVGVVAGSALGALASGNAALTLGTLLVVSASASVVLLGSGVGPPGPMMIMIATGVTAHYAAPTRLGGAGGDGRIMVIMAAVGVLTAWLVVVAPLLVPSVRIRDREKARSDTRLSFRWDADTRTIVLRVVLGTAIAIAVAAPIGVHRVYWVLLSLIGILQNQPAVGVTLVRAVDRVLGTLVGVLVFALLARWDPNGVVLALVVAALLFSAQSVMRSSYGLGQTLVTPMALLSSSQGSRGDLRGLVADRVLDTLLGAGIALLVLLVALSWRRRPRRPRFTPRRPGPTPHREVLPIDGRSTTAPSRPSSVLRLPHLKRPRCGAPRHLAGRRQPAGSTERNPVQSPHRRRIVMPKTKSVATVLAICLTAVSGAVDALTYSSLGNVYSSAMTGNIALFGISVSHPTATLLQHVLVAFAAYVVGLAIAGFFVGDPHPGTVDWPARATGAFLVEFAALTAVLVLWVTAEPDAGGVVQFTTLTLTALAIGVQSGAFRALTVASGVLGSTYLTGNLTVWVLRLTRGTADWPGLISMLALVAGALVEAYFVFHLRVLAGILPGALLAVVLLVALSPGFRTRNASPGRGR